MKKTLLIILIMLSTAAASAQFKTVTGTNKTGMTWLITPTGTKVNLNLSLTPAALGLPSNTTLALQQKSDSLKILMKLVADLSVRVRTIELDSIHYLNMFGKGTKAEPLSPIKY